MRIITGVETIILHVPVTRGGIADSPHHLTHWGAPGVVPPHRRRPARLRLHGDARPSGDRSAHHLLHRGYLRPAAAEPERCRRRHRFVGKTSSVPARDVGRTLRDHAPRPGGRGRRAVGSQGEGRGAAAVAPAGRPAATASATSITSIARSCGRTTREATTCWSPTARAMKTAA